MPTTSEVQLYSTTLPTIYKHILGAFPAAAPGRRAGDPLALSTLEFHLNGAISPDEGGEYDQDEILEACRQLAENGFLQIKNGIAVQPTELGEQLIGVLTGQSAPKRIVPSLPKPAW